MTRPGADRRGRPSAASYRRRRLLVAVLVLTLVTVVTLLGAGLAGVGPFGGTGTSGSVARTSAPPARTPELPPYAAPTPILSAPDGAAPGPDPEVLAGLLGPGLADPRLGPRVGVAVLDVASGAVLFERDPARAAVPASTAKLTTALAVELAVAPGTRLATRVVQGATPGQVVLVGGGDPTLSSAADGNLYPGAATVSDLAAQVSAALAAGSPGVPVTEVLVDGRLFPGAVTAPGWGSGDAPSSYAAPVTAAMVDGGRVGPRDEGVRSGQPDVAAGRALARALGVPDVPVTVGAAPAGAVVLGEVRSPPVEQLVEIMLSSSDNVLAEALSRQVALATDRPADFAGGVEAVRATLQGAGLDVGGLVLKDGSGLSVQDRVPPALLVAILDLAAGDPAGVGRGLLSGLPVAGWDGTLTERFTDSDADGEVRAKTGTLDGVSALAGVVQTRDGRLLAFAFMADAVPAGGRYGAEDALDEVAQVLAGCGCR